NLNGQGMEVSDTRARLGMWEPGAGRLTHQEYEGRMTMRDNSKFTAPSGNAEHANHVAGTMIAKGVNPDAKGMAWQAKLDAYDSENDLAEMATAANEGMLVSNHSYGPSFATAAGDIWKRGYYDQGAADWDAFAIASPYHLSIQAIGNDRDETATPTIIKYDILMGESNAKNFLGVGAIEMITGTAQNYTQASDAVMSDFSSFGPTDDGRIKPEVVAAGVGIYSAKSATDATYGTSQGTSMAAPAVTSALFLVQQHYKNISGNFMKAASLKAMAIHNVDETGTTEGPDYAFGFGLLNVEKMVKFLNNDGRNHFWQETSLANGATYTKAIKTSGGKSLKVTIVWNDPAATPLANNNTSLDNRTSRLVNDLDVRIKKADGTDLALPWKLDPANPANAATRGDNLVDNIEQISFDNVPAGNYTIQVTHKGTLAATQDFSIMVSGISQIEVEQNTAFISTGSGSYNFGNVNVGSNSGDITFTVKNTGATALLLSNFQINGTDAAMFTSVNFVTTTINVSANTTFTLKFTPTSAGAKTAFITIGNNSAGENPYTFTVNGTGVAVANSNPFISVKQNTTLIPHSTGTHNFGNINVGSNSGMVNFTVENLGNANLELSNFQITGTDALMFSTTNFITTTVNASNSTTFGLQFAPTSNGAKFATVSIGNNNALYTPMPTTFSNKTDVDNNLSNNSVVDSYLYGGTLYVGTSGGLSVSTDGGNTFTNKSIAGALSVLSFFADGGTFYVGANNGLSFSTDGGTTFKTRNNANSGIGSGIGEWAVSKIYANGSTIYAATNGGLSFSTDGGTTFKTRNTSNSNLVSGKINDIYVDGGTIYVATGASANGALSFTTDGGETFANRNMANSMIGNAAMGVYVSGGVIYAATTSTTGAGLSFSTDGGTTFANKTTANGLGGNFTNKVYVHNGTVYVATDGGLSFSTDGGNTFANR
ncbi:MAG: choice-of-anchor D domain-containing protein, partial [Bacteroidetes bacterium]